MTKETDKLREIFDCALRCAADIFNKNEEHSVAPMWHAIAGNGEHMLICTPWTSDLDKDIALAGLRDMFCELDVQRYAFICEGWVVVLNKQNMSVGGLVTRASNHPDRREVVRIVAEDRTGRTLSGHYQILRPEHGPPKLSPFKEDPPGIKAGGRMANMFERSERLQ